MRTYTTYSLILLGHVFFYSMFCYSQEAAIDNTIDEASQKIDEASQKIRREFKTTADEAMATFKAEMTSIIKKVAENGRLDEVQLLVDQRDLFYEKKKIPTADEFQTAVKAYQRKVNAELSKVQQLYQTGIKFRVQELDLANATKLRSQIVEIEKQARLDYFGKSGVKEGASENDPDARAPRETRNEKPEQIDLTKLGGTLLKSYTSARTGNRYELWQFWVQKDNRTIKLIHADYGEAWTAYHPISDVWTDVRCESDGYFTASWGVLTEGKLKFQLKIYE